MQPNFQSSMMQARSSSCHGLVASDKDKYENEVCGILPSYLVGVISDCHHFFTIVANDSCTFDPSKRSLTSVLDEVNSFMLSSPNEIYTLFLEDETQNSFANIVDNRESASHFQDSECQSNSKQLADLKNNDLYRKTRSHLRFIK